MVIRGKLQITTPSDREIVMTRVFDAPRNLVFDAWTKPELLKRWLTGPEPWILDVFEVDLRVGGSARFVWRKGEATMGMTMTYREIVRPERLVNTEKFDNPWYPGVAISTLVLIERDGKTTATNTMLYETKDIRDSVLKTPMDEGVEYSYTKLDKMLAEARKAATGQ